MSRRRTFVDRVLDVVGLRSTLVPPDFRGTLRELPVVLALVPIAVSIRVAQGLAPPLSALRRLLPHRERTVAALLTDLDHGGFRRGRAIWALARRPQAGATAEAALQPLLRHPEARVRRAAAQALTELNPDRDPEPILAAVGWADDAPDEPRASRLVRHGVHRLRALEPVPTLAAALDRTDAYDRLRATMALAHLEREAAALRPMLVAAGDVDPDVRTMAAGGLGRRPEPEAKAALRTLRDDHVRRVRSAARRALRDAH